MNSAMRAGQVAAGLVMGILLIMMVELRDYTFGVWWDTPEQKVTEAEMQARIASQRYLLARRRDSLVREMRSWPDSDVIIRSDDLPQSYQDALRSNVMASLRIVRRVPLPVARPARTAVIAIIDTAFHVPGMAHPGGFQAEHIMPEAMDGRTCVVILRIAMPWQLDPGGTPSWAKRSTSAPPDVLGQCSFYAAFGLPGTGMREWLQRSGYLLAAWAAWWTGEKTREYWRVYGPPSDFFLFNPTTQSISMRHVSLAELRCAAGRFDQCPDAYALSRPLPPEAGLFTERASQGENLSSGLAGTLNDLAINITPAKFATLWQSERPLDVTFRELTGVPLNEFLSRQSNDRIGPIHLGPAPPFGMTLAMFIMAAVLLGGMAFASRYRELI